MLATLKDRIMQPDGTLAPWTSPNGTPMSIAAATPTIPWSDLISSLTPNGRWLDYTLPQPAENYTPRGELKQSFVQGLYLVGNTSGFYSPPGIDHESDLTTWNAITNAGEPTNTPAYDDLINIFVHYHGAQYVLDGEAVPNTEAPAPMLLSSGFTDDLFPVAETLRYATLVKRLYPTVPLKLMYVDYGHMRGQNKTRRHARGCSARQRLDRPLRDGQGQGAQAGRHRADPDLPERRELRRAVHRARTGPSCIRARASCAPRRRRPSRPRAGTRT